MHQKIKANSRLTLWIERIAWNAAAGAVLAVMILVLLGSLRLLDQVAPHQMNHIGEPAAVSGAAPTDDQNVAASEANRPSG